MTFEEKVRASGVQIVVASHRRSGTHLTIDTLINNFDCFDPSRRQQPLSFDGLVVPGNADGTLFRRLSTAFEHQANVWKTHNQYNFRSFVTGAPEPLDLIDRIIDCSHTVYVYRDGRDVLVSLFNYRSRYDKSFATVAFSDFIRQLNDYDVERAPTEMNRAEYWAWHVNSWKKDDVFFLSFDELREDWAGTLSRISRFLDQSPKPRQQNPIRNSRGWFMDTLERVRLKAFRSMSRKHTTSISFDKGVSGRWQEFFSTDDLKFFQKYGGATNESLGYSQD